MNLTSISKFFIQVYKSGRGGFGGRGQRVLLQLWDTAGQERYALYSNTFALVFHSSFVTNQMKSFTTKIIEKKTDMHNIVPPTRKRRYSIRKFFAKFFNPLSFEFIFSSR